MNSIYKYPINMSHGNVVLDMPQGARILRVGNQREELVLWAMVDRDALLCKRTVRVVVTGEQFIGDLGIFLGTVLFEDGGYVVHLFDDGESGHWNLESGSWNPRPKPWSGEQYDEPS